MKRLIEILEALEKLSMIALFSAATVLAVWLLIHYQDIAAVVQNSLQ